MAELKGKQKKFADEYLLSWNAADAARKAGYSENSAASIGSENLRKPQIAAYIRARAQAREIFLPATGHERDIHARIARERLHVVRLDAVVVARCIDSDDAVAERVDADAQRIARLSERRKTCQQRQT